MYTGIKRKTTLQTNLLHPSKSCCPDSRWHTFYGNWYYIYIFFTLTTGKKAGCVLNLHIPSTIKAFEKDCARRIMSKQLPFSKQDLQKLPYNIQEFCSPCFLKLPSPIFEHKSLPGWGRAILNEQQTKTYFSQMEHTVRHSSNGSSTKICNTWIFKKKTGYTHFFSK